MRVRTLVGSLLILIFVAVWILGAIAVADHLPDNKAAELAFYVIAGLGWGLPVMPLMRWMSKDDQKG